MVSLLFKSLFKMCFSVTGGNITTPTSTDRYQVMVFFVVVVVE